MTTAVAISTTGDPHRLDSLRRCVAGWDQALSTGDSLFITVDGDEAACERVWRAVFDWTGSVFRVGQRALDPRNHPDTWYAPETGQRLGVAVNKNTGLELMMDNTKAEHLFLSDDDAWPLYPQSLDKHIVMSTSDAVLHSGVYWGKHRLNFVGQDPDGFSWAEWTWPRGVVLYTHRIAVQTAGGMDERFGPGGHEHVEWSKRFYNLGLTPAEFCSPASYATRNAMGAAALWHCEDMPRPGEPRHVFQARKRAHTSIRTQVEDWRHIDQIMTEREGSTAFVPYRAPDNGRSSATLCEYPPSSLGAEESK